MWIVSIVMKQFRNYNNTVNSETLSVLFCVLTSFCQFH